MNHLPEFLSKRGAMERLLLLLLVVMIPLEKAWFWIWAVGAISAKAEHAAVTVKKVAAIFSGYIMLVMLFFSGRGSDLFDMRSGGSATT